MKGLTVSIVAAASLTIAIALPAAANNNDTFDQLRRENLEKDAVNFDELRQANREKSGGKPDFDQLRRENLEKDAIAIPVS
ncbi:MAG TPA: hypothetical protein V6D02_00730 [Candidatus Obscuribacterales bacterium]